MPTQWAYAFKLAAAAKDGLVEDGHLLKPGEWAWVDRTIDYTPDGIKEKTRWLMIYACCPDCKLPMTLFRRRGKTEPAGHTIDKDGNIKPSVLHSYKIEGVEQCGFHTQPTKLLGFIDLRGT